MKFILFVTFLASAAYMTSAKKLLMVGGMNGGGMATGMNGGLLGQGLMVGGRNPALFPAGGAVIAQPPFPQMLPPYMLQPSFAAAPYMLPNPQVQMPPQPAMPYPPMMGLPYFANPNLQVLPPQQQAAGGLNPMGNGQRPQGDMPAGPVPRIRRTLLRRMQAANANIEVTPTPSITERPAE
ncbi:secretory calcium-binding phosphoprotein 9 [Pygocentrus nattereri]|uniref:secretory calcium-binding phosphoprotein 9 n=1 Tax=Pygocentrus nattereri TaxID=42514 RepID=UPI0008148C1B|nr:secretory calcium-binding phosphoprotein 9 [Pygocentrus nattereri]